MAKPLYMQRAIQENLLGRSSKRKREASIDYGIHSTPTKTSIVAKPRSPLDINWDLLKSWPEGVQEEEGAMRDFLKRLKIFHLEQETKNLFVLGINDDKQTIYTPAQVHELEGEVQELKGTLEERKRVVAVVREQIETLADELGEFDGLQQDMKQAQDLSSSIAELEWQLERLRASPGGQHSAGPQAPTRGSVTRDEAVEMLNRQVRAGLVHRAITHSP